jgi:outer membrane protein TolC
LNDDYLFGSNGESYALMAVATWNAWGWGQTKARVSAARSHELAARQLQRGHMQQIEFEVREAWHGVEEARARILVAAGAVAYAEKALAILEDRFEQGVARITDLLDAETTLDDARLQLDPVSTQRATRTLDFAVGLSPVPEALP